MVKKTFNGRYCLLLFNGNERETLNIFVDDHLASGDLWTNLDTKLRYEGYTSILHRLSVLMCGNY
jgi:hypothetical protein